jgi:hypothetical protein
MVGEDMLKDAFRLLQRVKGRLLTHEGMDICISPLLSRHTRHISVKWAQN